MTMNARIALGAAILAAPLALAACTPDPSTHWTDRQVAAAYAATEQTVTVLAECGPPGTNDLASVPAIQDAWRAGYCWAVTDEPTAFLQHWADEGYNERLQFALKNGFRP
jgi:hypothetical protein